MPSAAQRSRKAAAKAAQRKAVVAGKKRAERVATSLSGRVAVAAACPVERCFRSAALFELGIGHVVLARRLPSNLICSAVFLVDTYCLGVKDVFYKEGAPSDFEDVVEEISATDDVVDMDLPSARKLLHDAVAYTASFDLTPAKDHAVIETLFGEADARQSIATFTFGRNGKPLYVQGPNDKPDRIRQITRALTARCGLDGWDMVLKADMMSAYEGNGILDDDTFLTSDTGSADTEVLDDVPFERLTPAVDGRPDQ